MPELTRLYSRFKDELITRSIDAKIVSESFDSKDGKTFWKVAPTIEWTAQTPVLLTWEKTEGREVLFSADADRIDRLALRVEIPSDTGFPLLAPANSAFMFSNLFWLANVDAEKKTAKIQWLPCGTGRQFSGELDIGLTDKIIASEEYRQNTADSLTKKFTDEYVFACGKKQCVFIETFVGNSDAAFKLYGLTKRADIAVKDGKWLVEREMARKEFPRNLKAFQELSVATYPCVRFIEASKAREALESIQEEQRSGTALIALWEKYAEIEMKRADELKTVFGEMRFERLRSGVPGISKVRLSGPPSLSNLLDDYREKFLDAALECKDERYTVRTLKATTLELNDENDILPDEGVFVISTRGDLTVQKRREKARAALETPTFLQRNIFLLLEDHAGDMLDLSRGKHLGFSDSAREFMRDKFGVDQLTDNQREAVEIALNTPDVAVIQGPPGTGKSTVVAAICHRLLETGRDERGSGKAILVSAYQNDTLEHTASKIYTFGLPTVKIGKATEGLRAEDVFIQEMKNRIGTELQKLPRNRSGRFFDLTARLATLLTALKQGTPASEVRQGITELMADQATELAETLYTRWQDIKGGAKGATGETDKMKQAVRGLRTEHASYGDDGFKSVRRLLSCGVELTLDEKALLDKAPTGSCDDPVSDDFLGHVRDIKDRLTDRIQLADDPVENGKDLVLKEWLTDAVESLTARIETAYDDRDIYLPAALESLMADLEGNPDVIRDAIAEYGQSLAATNQKAGGRELSDILGNDTPTVSTVVLEEAARSNPLDLLIPMTKASHRIILVGDQNQLPHLLEDDIADEAAALSNAENAREKLKESLFGIIYRNLEKSSVTRRIRLTEQFRMHPFIGDFISRIYYNGELKAGRTNQAEMKRHGLTVPWAREKVAVFCDVKGDEESGKSKTRKREAIRIFKLLKEIEGDAAFENLTVGIITFYAKQERVLFDEAVNTGYAVCSNEGEFEIACAWRKTADGREKLRIGTVDSFQGKEFDIVILSTVRSNFNAFPRTEENAKRIFGFLALPNRLNVACSRAQRLLIVVGDGQMYGDDLAKAHVEGLHEFYTTLSTDKQYGNRI